MSDFQKSLTRFMYIALVCVVVIGVWHLHQRSRSASKADSTGRVSASGTCIVRAKPELVEVTMGVRKTEATATAANNYVRSRIRGIMGVLTRAGVAVKDIQTQSFNLNPSWDERHRVLTWAADEELRVRIRKIENAAVVIDEAVKSGANQVGGLDYTVDDVGKLRAQGRAKAAKAAHQKAAELAASLGGSIGRLVSAQEGYPGDYGGYNYHASLRMLAQRAVEEPYLSPSSPEELTMQPGELVITVEVTATYELI